MSVKNVLWELGPKTAIEALEGKIDNLEQLVAQAGGGDARKPSPPRLSMQKIEWQSGVDITPLWVTSDGILLGSLSNMLYESDDGEQNYDQIATIGGPAYQAGAIGAVRDLGNGELLVVFDQWTGGSEPARVYVSDGYPSIDTVWNQTFQTDAMGINFNNHWGVSAFDNIVLLSEYGDWGVATRAYLSQDYGQTFQQVFDFLDYAEQPNLAHIHASCYDPYRDMLWITTGDAVPNLNIFYSLDRGQSWIQLTPIINQFVTIIPFPDCVCFLSDGKAPANGVFRLPIRDKFDIKADDIELALRLDTIDALTYIGRMAYMNYYNPEHPVYFSWTLSNNVPEPMPAKIHASFDGYKFFEIYTDDIKVEANGQGVGRIMGPTAGGDLVGVANYGSLGRYILKAKAPVWR